MSNETIEHLAGFNSNPVCLGVGPTDVPQEPVKFIVLAIYVLAAVFMVVTSLWYMYMRQYRRRLKIRALNPIVMGSMGSACIILVRAYYNFVGREYLSCSKLRDYMANVGTLNPQIATQKVDPDNKKHVSDHTIKLEAHSVVTSGVTGDELSGFFNHNVATPKQWFKGFWNHFLTFEDVLMLNGGSKHIAFHNKWRFHEDTRISSLRELSYDMLLTILFSTSLFIGMGFRIGLNPVFQPVNGCSGCAMDPVDIGVLVACVVVLVIMQSIIIHKTRSVSDPLGYRNDVVQQGYIASICWICYILASTDPGHLMKTQRIDWFFVESLTAFLLHLHRCILQLYRVSRTHRRAEQNIRLIDVLQDPKAAIMFEKYLMGELASENLLFWREGLKYKVNFDKNHDFDYSQQVAKMLLRTFIAKHAQLPINISGTLRDTIESRFKGGFVGKTVFDEALCELYKMMQNGPFYRFVRSAAFQDYAKNSADFSMMVQSKQGDAGAGNVLAQYHRADSNVEAEGMRFGSNGAGAHVPHVPSDVRFEVTEFIRSL